MAAPLVAELFGFGLDDIITLLPWVESCDWCDQIPAGWFVLAGAIVLLFAYKSPLRRVCVVAAFIVVTVYLVLQPVSGLVVSTIGGGPLQIIETDKETDCQELLTPLADSGAHTDPAWSKDGTRLAYVRDTDGTWRLHVTDMELFLRSGTRVAGDRVVGISGNGHQRHPTWSPDGAIALIRTADSVDNATAGTLVVRWSDGSMSELDGRSRDLRPDWSPDGRWIVFARQDQRSGRTSLHVVEVRDGSFGQVLPLLDGNLVTAELGNDAPVNLNHPRWSPDGESVLFVFHREDGSGSTGLGRVGVDINQHGFRLSDLQVIRRPPEEPDDVDGRYSYGGPTEPTWSADGRSIVYSAVPVETSDPTRAAESRALLIVADINDGTLENRRPLVYWDDEGSGSCPHFGAMDWSPSPTLVQRVRGLFSRG